MVLGLIAVVGFLLGSAGVLVVLSARDGGQTTTVTARVLRPPPGETAAIWSGWLARRAAAYAHGSPAELRRLYVGRAGRRDVALLQQYAARRLSVASLTEQTLSIRLTRQTTTRISFVVVSRLAAAVARDRAGATVSLPTGKPRARSVSLAEVGGSWRVASVREVRSRP